jgi:hypothetical protein
MTFQQIGKKNLWISINFLIFSMIKKQYLYLFYYLQITAVYCKGGRGSELIAKNKNFNKQKN